MRHNDVMVTPHYQAKFNTKLYVSLCHKVHKMLHLMMPSLTL